MTRILVLLLAVLLNVTPAFAEDVSHDASSEQITCNDIIELAARPLRVSADNARTWHAGVIHLDDWQAQLERTLLEALGPEELRQGRSAADDLKALIEHSEAPRPLTVSGRETLELLSALIERLETLEARAQQNEQALERERAAHQGTQEKLAALRKIEVEMDQRDDGSLEYP